MENKFKRNNPLNIRWSQSNNWVGQTGMDNGFCVFKNADYGFRAAFMLLKNYHKKGFNTIEKIVKRFAPPSENPTYNYIRFVCKKMEALGYDDYDVGLECYPLDLRNDMIVVDLIACMAKFESGLNVQSREVASALYNLGLLSWKDEEVVVRSVRGDVWP